jgi:hypothetical protein
MRKRITPELLENSRLDSHTKDICTAIAQCWPGATIEGINPAQQAERVRQSESFNAYCDAVVDDMGAMSGHRELLRAHRSRETLQQIERFQARFRHKFFNLLFRRGDCSYIDLRAISRRKTKKGIATKVAATKMVATGDAHAIDKFVHRYAGKYDLYFGVAARRKEGSGNASNCGIARALFADVDFKSTPETEARARLEAFKPAVDILVTSGGGFHCYWLLDPPCDLQRDGEKFKKHLRGLAKAMGGDIAVATPAHLLRIPETLNHKYSPPREVTCAQFGRLPDR